MTVSEVRRRRGGADKPTAAHGTPQPASRTSLQTAYLFFVYAALAGVCGALSGVVGKLAVTADSVQVLQAHLRALLPLATTSKLPLSALNVPLRGLLLAMNTVFTAQMWRFYVKSLALGPTPVSQIVNTGVNFAVSALAGLLLFGEQITLLWACGALLVVIGLALVVTDAGNGM